MIFFQESAFENVVWKMAISTWKLKTFGLDIAHAAHGMNQVNTMLANTLDLFIMKHSIQIYWNIFNWYILFLVGFLEMESNYMMVMSCLIGHRSSCLI